MGTRLAAERYDSLLVDAKVAVDIASPPACLYISADMHQVYS